MLKILVIKPSSLGDIIHGLQVIQTLKVQLPEVEVSWVVRDIFKPVVEACEAVDHVYVFARKGGAGAFAELIRELRKVHFDWVLDMQGLARSGILTAFCHAKEKAGRSDSRELAHLSYQHRVPLPADGKQSHAVEILLQFLPLFDLKPILQGQLSFRSDGSEDALLADMPEPILIFPSSRRAEKDWPGYAELTERLLEALPNVPVFWVGHERCSHEDGWSQKRFRNLTGETSLLQVIGLIEKARLVVSNDSGPMHLAAAMGKRLVTVFGPTDPKRFGPFPLTHPNHCVVRAPDGDFSKLSVDEVLPAVKNSV